MTPRSLPVQDMLTMETESQKLEAIGLLACVVAHDLNDMLTAIIGYTDLSLRRVGPRSSPFGFTGGVNLRLARNDRTDPRAPWEDGLQLG